MISAVLRRVSVCLLVVAVTSFTGAARAADETPVEALRALLDPVESFRSRFVQSVRDQRGQVLQRMTGELWLARDARFRIVMAAPWAQEIVSDGIHVYTHDPDLEQVLVSTIAGHEHEIPVLLLQQGTAISDAFTVDVFDDEQFRRFVLVPTEEGGLLRTVILTFDAGVVVAIAVDDSTGQRTEITFTDPTPGAEIAPDLFHFDIPPGVDVVRDD